VKIHTVGLGSTQGTQIKVDGFTLATRLDEELLKQIAATTDASITRRPTRQADRGSRDRTSADRALVPHEVTSWSSPALLLRRSAPAGPSSARERWCDDALRPALAAAGDAGRPCPAGGHVWRRRGRRAAVRFGVELARGRRRAAVVAPARSGRPAGGADTPVSGQRPQVGRCCRSPTRR
jgi:hypothetical protein